MTAKRPVKFARTPQTLALERRRRRDIAERPGPPSLLNDSLIDAVVERLREGHTMRHACNAVGILEGVFRKWLAKGRRQWEDYLGYLERGDEVPDNLLHPRLPYMRLCVEVERASSEPAQRWLADLRRKGGKDWKSDAFLLERRFPDDWGRKERRDMNLDVGGTVQLLVAPRKAPSVEEWCDEVDADRSGKLAWDPQREASDPEHEETGSGDV